MACARVMALASDAVCQGDGVGAAVARRWDELRIVGVHPFHDANACLVVGGQVNVNTISSCTSRNVIRLYGLMLWVEPHIPAV